MFILSKSTGLGVWVWLQAMDNTLFYLEFHQESSSILGMTPTLIAESIDVSPNTL